MDTYKIESDGKTFTFDVIKNTTEPCPQCGVPACGKEDILWYEEADQKLAMIFDGGYFDMAIENCIEKYIKTMDYNTLPTFLKDWSEQTGWSDCWDYIGYELDTNDFLNTLSILEKGEIGKWISQNELNTMKEMAKHVQKMDLKLKIVRG